MPKPTDTLKSEIDRAEGFYSKGAPNFGTEILAVANARALVQLVEVLERIEKHLETLPENPLTAAEQPLKLQAPPKPAAPKSRSSTRK